MLEPSTIQEEHLEDTHTELILKRLTLVCIAITAGISILAIIGWALNWLLLAQISPSYIPMAQSTALSFVILSFALFVYARKPKHPEVNTFVRVVVFIFLILNLIILIDFFTGVGLDIEQILYPQPEKFGGVPIGRMSPITAANFLLSACALLLLLISPEGRHRAKSAASYLAFIVFSAGLVMVLGYLYGTPLLYGGTIIPVALTTAIAFVFMGTGLVAAAGQHYFPVSSFVGSSLQARLMRAFVPFTIAIILINGFLDIVFLRLAGNYVLALSLSAILSLILVSIVISKIVRAIGSNIDSAETERKRAEEALSHSNERLRRFIDSNIVGVVIASPSGSIIETNDYYLRTIGYTREEFEQGMVDWRNITPPEWLPADEKAIEELRERGTCTPYEKEYVRRDGTRVSVFLSDAMLPGHEEQIAAFVLDITERKRVEKALRESDERYRLATEAGGIAVWRVSMPDMRVESGGAVERLIGYEEGEISDWYAVTHPDDRDKLREIWEGIGDGRIDRYDVEHRMIHKDGSIMWFLIHGQVIKHPDKNKTQVIGTTQDITERKRAEEKMRLSEERFSKAFNAGPAGMTITRIADGKFIDANEAFLNMFEFTRAEVIGHTSPELKMWTPEERKKLIQRQLEAGGLSSFELTAKAKSGKLVNIFFSSIPIALDGEEHLVTIMIDITERKRAEEIIKKSESMLNETQRLTKVGGWEYDVEKNKITWTDEVYRIYGVSPEKYDPNDITQDIQFYASEEQGIIERAFEEAVREGKSYDLRLKFTNAKGKKLWVRTIGQAEVKDEGVVRVYGNIMDITEIKAAEEELHKFAAQLEDRVEERTGELAESQIALTNMVDDLNRTLEALRRSEERYRMLVEYSPDGIMVHDTEKFTFANKAASDILGATSPEELIGKRIHEMIHPDYRETVRKRLQMEKEGKEAPLIEQKFIRMDGTPIDVEVVAFPIKYHDRIEVHSVVRDITERKKAVDAIKAANLRLMELDRIKSMFIASTSHELRTPLNSIIGFSSIMLEGWSGKLSSEQKEQLQLIHNSGQQLLALINDVIDISKIEAGKLEAYYTEFRLKEVVDEAVATLGKNIEEKGLSLSVNVPDITLTTDRRRLLQCLLNCLSNAMKFTEKGSISIKAKSINNLIDISITDTGIGIKEDDILKLFAPFVRLEYPISTPAGGTGLGLYLTKKLVEEVLGGTVAVKSKYGKGSTFSIRMPERR